MDSTRVARERKTRRSQKDRRAEFRFAGLFQTRHKPSRQFCFFCFRSHVATSMGPAISKLLATDAILPRFSASSLRAYARICRLDLVEQVKQCPCHRPQCGDSLGFSMQWLCVRPPRPASKCQIFRRRNHPSLRRSALGMNARAKARDASDYGFNGLSASLGFSIDCKKI